MQLVVKAYAEVSTMALSELDRLYQNPESVNWRGRRRPEQLEQVLHRELGAKLHVCGKQEERKWLTCGEEIFNSFNQKQASQVRCGKITYIYRLAPQIRIHSRFHTGSDVARLNKDGVLCRVTRAMSERQLME